MVVVVVVVLLVSLVQVIPLTGLGSRVHAGLGSSSIPDTVIPRYYKFSDNVSCPLPVIVGSVCLVVLTVGRVTILLSILTTETTVSLLKLVSRLVAALARVTEASILDIVLLSRPSQMTRTYLVVRLRSSLWP